MGILLLGIPPEEILGTFLEDGIDDLRSRQPANPADILDYYFRPKRPLLEAKLILVDAARWENISGQSAGSQYIRQGEEDRGHQDHPLGCAAARGERGASDVWDFGGQEIMHATHPFFLTRRSLYLRC